MPVRPGYNPVRRNRNIGTSKQGHGQDNRLVIPRNCAAERDWTGQLGPHRIVHSFARSRNLTFIVAANHGGFIHTCSVEDLVHILTFLPAEDWSGLNTFVLRQPTRKQFICRPAWGRLCHQAHLGVPGGEDMYVGPVVMLDAINCNQAITWTTALGPSDQAELERLRQDGHDIRRVGRRFLIKITPGSARAHQLYRTFLHEIGHWVDYRSKVVEPANNDSAAFDELSNFYFSRPVEEREAFAHAYATRMAAHLRKFGIIPFEPLGTPSSDPEAAC